jgi:hypothetical protein
MMCATLTELLCFNDIFLAKLAVMIYSLRIHMYIVYSLLRLQRTSNRSNQGDLNVSWI